jgi:hypothetical protein
MRCPESTRGDEERFRSEALAVAIQFPRLFEDFLMPAADLPF